MSANPLSSNPTAENPSPLPATAHAPIVPRNLVQALVWFLAFLLWSYIGTWLGRHLLKGPDHAIGPLTAGLVRYLVLAAAVLMMVAQFRPAIPHVLALRTLDWKNALLLALLALPLTRFADVVQEWTEMHLPLYDLTFIARVQSTLGSDETHNPWRDGVLVACFLAPIVEEVFFRGFLGRGLIARYGFFFGTLCATALFAVVHIGAPGLGYALVAGIAYEFVYLTNKSLLAPILLHALGNVLGFSWRILPAYSWLTAAALTAVIALGYLAYSMRTRWFWPDGRELSLGYPTAEMPPTSAGAVPRTGSAPLSALLIGAAVYAGFIAVVIVECQSFLLQNSYRLD
jgi:membrane protease YdiL (CAAX protease family)